MVYNGFCAYKVPPRAFLWWVDAIYNAKPEDIDEYDRY